QRVTLTQAQAVDLMQRSNLVNLALDQQNHWRFNCNATVTMYGSNGQPLPVQTGQGNGTWTYQRAEGPPPFHYIQVAQGQQPAAALEDLFQNRDKYGIDCATGVTVLNLRAQLETLRQQMGSD